MREKFVVKQEHFEGPLDLLLDLIEREKLPVSQISLARVTDEFLKRVKALPNIDQEELAEFLVIAAQLMLLKSRALLPELELSKEDELSIDELERRLREYKRIKELALLIRKREGEGRRVFPRESYLGLPVIFYPPPGVKANLLKEAFAAVLQTIPQLTKLAEEKIRKVISMEEKIREIQARLAAGLEHAFSDIIRGSREKVEVIVSFLAILELAKEKLVLLHQRDRFGDITIRKAVRS